MWLKLIDVNFKDKNIKCKAFLKISIKGDFVGNDEVYSCIIDEKRFKISK